MRKSKPSPKFGTPYADRVLIRPDKPKTKTDFGFMIADTGGPVLTGVIVAVGNGKLEDGVMIPVRLRVGNHVQFLNYGFDEMEMDGGIYYLMREDNISYVF